ncbi:MAG: methyltransferase domain-containing protein [Promethearchaeota archaeon]
MRIEPFEKYFLRYEQWFNDNPNVYKSELLAIKSLFPKRKKSIEIGVGSGKFAVPLDIMVGIEPSNKMRQLSLTRGIDVINAIGEILPIRKERFDLVLMVTTICFLDDIKMAFEEVYNILTSKGSFIIGFIDRNSPIGTKYQLQKKENVFYNVANFYSVDEVVSYLKIANFTKFEFSQTIFRPLLEIKDIEPIKPNYGEGSFVVIKAEK